MISLQHFNFYIFPLYFLGKLLHLPGYQRSDAVISVSISIFISVSVFVIDFVTLQLSEEAVAHEHVKTVPGYLAPREQQMPADKYRNAMTVIAETKRVA